MRVWQFWVMQFIPPDGVLITGHQTRMFQRGEFVCVPLIVVYVDTSHSGTELHAIYSATSNDSNSFLWGQYLSSTYGNFPIADRCSNLGVHEAVLNR
jgi:hypothetical protein